MKTTIQTQQVLRLLALVIATLFASAELLPNARAVVPAPDGGYAGGNTAEGHLALASLNTSAGLYNTAVGVYSLLSLGAGSFCTGVGAGTLLVNTADENTATGAGALLSNTTGENNTANGSFALFNNTEGNQNTAVGANALFDNTTGNFNTASGYNALISNTEGSQNTAVGYVALATNTTGSLNTATGYRALFNNTTGATNTAIGDFTLEENTTGFANTAVGDQALGNNTTGTENTALGYHAGLNVTTASNVICIGAEIDGADVPNSCYIGQIFGQSSPNGLQVVVNSDNKLGTIPSSQRFKEQIKAIEETSKALFSLRPVSFRYKKEIDPAGTPQLGLVAEEVEKVNPNLVVRDKEGRPYSVRYDQVNAMLLNEFLKEHRKVEEQQAVIAQLKSEMATVVAHLREHDSEIQTVRTQIEPGKAVLQMASTNP